MSFIFNLGEGYTDSSPFERINALEPPSEVITEEFPEYNTDDGEVLPGLTEKRQQEVDLANTPSDIQVIPYVPCP